MHSIARRMISSLFYIELLELPASYSCPGLVYLRLLCRVPTGLPLVSLLYRLRLNRTMLMYGATASRYSKGQLVTAGALQRCKEGKYFSRLIKVEVSSHRAKVEVKICTKGSEPQDISNTPYALQDLVRDSRFDCVFGRDDHQIPMRGLPTAEVALEEMERLRETLDGLIGELKDVEYW